jgi:endonuclease YncB( thermonuclease family)
MPFSTERTALIKAKLDDRLTNDSLNDWERSFLTDMSAKFDLYGERTKLTTAQYRKLHQLLEIEKKQASKTSASIAETSSVKAAYTPKRKAPTKSYSRRKRPFRSPSPMRALYAPQRAIRRSTRAAMLPIILVLAVVGFISSAFDGTGSSSSTRVQATSSPSPIYLVVTGSTVNQREGPGTQYPVMGQLSEGARVRQLRQQAGWTQIASSAGTGWMSSNFLSGTQQSSSTSTTRSSTVRSAPASNPNARIVQARNIRVIDGDTVTISGERANVRLVGFNTPETRSPACAAELQVGRTATARLTALLRQAQTIEFRRVACACRPGTEGTRDCNFGRQCGSLIVDGTDVGRTLISENLAVPYICGRTSCPPRPGNWCR